MSEVIREHYVTFGVQYGRREGDMVHPLGMYSDGYAVIEAPDFGTAHDMAIAIFGIQWAFMYEREDWKPDRYLSGGELLRISWTRH